MIKKITGLLRKKETGEINEVLELLKVIDSEKLPRHVAIIMDGNGRWANQRGLPRSLGHRAGVESLRDIVRACSEIKIQVLTVYAFSTENWKRPQDEVNVLMDLLVEYLEKEINELCANGVAVNPVGRLEELPLSARNALKMAVEKSKTNSGLILNLALNYGGRAEILDAVRSIVEKVANNRLAVNNIDDKIFSENLYTAGQPDPDLLIRPSGDYRISNFLLWQLAYTEFWFTPVMWPDFRKVHLLRALADFQLRERRFGGLKR